MNHFWTRRTILTTTACACLALFTPPVAQAEECSNQGVIDACVTLCSAAEGVCGALCGAAEATCKFGCSAAEGACGLLCDVADGACFVGCAGELTLCGADCTFTCCPNPFCGCGGCFDDCDDDFDSCTNGCNANCDFCVLNCEDGCEADCDNCKLPCEADCQDLCIPFKKIGESCIPLVEPCDAGLVCWPNAFDGNVFQCFPDETDELFDDEFCLSMYSEELHNGAMNVLGLSQTYGAGGSASVGISDVVEVGTVYGRDGCYGCYIAECIGLETNIQVSVFASVGFYDTDIDGVKGQSRVLIESAGVELISFATGQVFSAPNFEELIGTTDCLSFGVGISPISVGLYDCETIVDKVGCLDGSGNLVIITNNPPEARCTEVVTCANAVTCVAGANIDNGSFDPDGDSITTNQSPSGPYGIGARTVTLTVTDSEGASASCNSQVTVDDCTPPEISCPAPSTAECESLEQAVVDPGDATVTDTCSSVTVNDPGASSYALGTTSVVYTATDGAGNTAACSTTVTVQDTTDPLIVCPDDATVECDGSGNTAELNAWLTAATASDSCGDVSITHDFVALSDQCGATGSATVTWTGEDVGGNTASCSATFTIVDRLSASITCPADRTLECPADTSIAANGSPAVADDCSDVLVASDDVTVPGPGGTETVTRSWTATDDCGFVSACDQVIDVVDTTRPSVSCSVTTDVLGPPNHKLKEVGLQVSVFDACDLAGATQSLVIEVWSDETEVPHKGDGTGKHAPDAKDLFADLRLRSERRGSEDGRVYLIVASAQDGSGNTGFGFCAVVVPHDQNEEGLAEVRTQADAALVVVQAASATATSIADVVVPLVAQGWTQHGVSEEMGPHQ